MVSQVKKERLAAGSRQKAGRLGHWAIRQLGDSAIREAQRGAPLRISVEASSDSVPHMRHALCVFLSARRIETFQKSLDTAQGC
jgi:hypothetical protein